jgi:hypothetical protein
MKEWAERVKRVVVVAESTVGVVDMVVVDMRAVDMWQGVDM